MRIRVESLRVWLLGSAVFLVLVIAGFIGSARYLRRHLLSNLPAKLGVNIVRETNNFTYCQSVQSRTAYCIRAAKSVEHTDGKIGLHDVSITLYGQKGDRNDRIYGDEFEYDQNAGVVRAQGVVHIDVQAAETAGGAKPGVNAGAKVLHVTTSDLVYMQKLGVAATSQPIEFQSGGMTGHATGADYASDSGVLMLHSAVDMSGMSGGKPATVTAAAAEFDDRNQVAYLTHATYASQGRTVEADHATLHRRPDGTLSRIEAQGNVTVQAQGATVVSQKSDVTLTATSQPETALLSGGVRYSSDEPLRQMRGQSEDAVIVFDKQAQPQPQHAVFTGAAHMTEKTRATEAAKEPWSTRDLRAAKVEVALVPAGPGRSEVRDEEATGNPKLTMVNNGSLASSAGEGTTELSADDLKAHMIAAADVRQPPQLDTIVGLGHTVLRQTTVDGMEQTSAGDTLNAKMRPRVAAVLGAAAGGAKAAPASQQIADMLLNAVQQGHVTMMRRVPAKSGAASAAGAKAGTGDDVERAMAERAVYDGDADRMTLTGSVQLMDAGSVLWANQVALDHGTGDAHATGAVKMNYAQDAASASGARSGSRAAGSGAQADEPTHILADRAELEHATEIATFYGKPARLWQGSNRVMAPVIELERAQRRLIARGDAGTGWSAAAQAAQVHTVLARAASDGPGAAKSDAAKAGPGAAGCAAPASAAATGRPGAGASGGQAASLDAVRVASGGLIYSDILRQAEFTGGFRADTVDGTIRATTGTVYLRPAAANGGAASGPALAGDLDRVVATGHVELDKPGMHATGERLVYTASDRIGLLTGGDNAPPKAVGAQGTTTGATLRFQSSCDGSGGGSVEALGASGEPVRTDARVSEDGKKEKGKR